MDTPAGLLVGTIARHWWVLALRGVAAIIFGILAFAWPGITLLALVFVFGVYAIIDGVTAIGSAAKGRWWTMVFVGILSILAGIVAFVWPGITALALLYVIAVWAIVRGVADIVAAIHLRKVIEGEWLLILAGVISIAFGVLLIAYPAAGILSVVWIIGIWAIIFGALEIGLAFRLRAAGRAAAEHHPEAPPELA